MIYHLIILNFCYELLVTVITSETHTSCLNLHFLYSVHDLIFGYLGHQNINHPFHHPI